MKPEKCRHIYFFSSFNINSVSARCRGLYPLEYLKNQHDIQFDFVYPGYRFGDCLRFARVFFQVLLFRKRNSIIVFHKLHNRGIYTSFLKLLLIFRRHNTFYDTDDADFIRYGIGNINYFAKKSSACILGSEFLKAHFKKLNPSVHLLTSPVVDHKQITKMKDRKLHLGWVGDFGLNTDGTSGYCHKRSVFQLVLSALSNFSEEVKLTILGIRNPTDIDEMKDMMKDRKNIELVCPLDMNWLDEDLIYSKIAEFDVGLSPLVDHDFNRAKSAYKAKQYLSCGVPVLASSVGENTKFINHGENGFLCSNSEDFLKGIKTFHSMSNEKYRRFSANALKTRSAFSVESYGTKLLRLFNSRFRKKM